MPREDEIRIIAYNIWQEDDCCDGRDVEHWLRAEVIWQDQQASNQSKASRNKKPKQTGKTTTKKRVSKKP